MTAGSGEALRQQLGEAAKVELIAHGSRELYGLDEFDCCAVAVSDAIWPLIEAALAAARVATATAEQQRIWELLAENCNLVGQVWLLHDVVKQAFPDAIAALGGSVPAPKGDRNEA